MACFPGIAPLPLATIRDAFQAVVDGAVDAAVVPIETLAQGTVREACDLLLASRLWIAAEVVVPVRLCLAAMPGETLDSVARVHSHVEALGQAETFLRSRPWHLVASANTAGAGLAIARGQERGVAAVMSPRAASINGLIVLASDIQTDARNRTRFLVVTAQQSPAWSLALEGPPRTSLSIVVGNEPGSLYRALGVLAEQGINMSKLESRPVRDRDWEYVFWVDLDDDLCQPARSPVLASLAEAAAEVRLLGCYRRVGQA
ncbi:MAG: ACT domain-containing protein [Chloroflexi bacterium]|nr:ACT domain-containing protein [Chloroflexota bacterium]